MNRFLGKKQCQRGGGREKKSRIKKGFAKIPYAAEEPE